MGGDRMARRSKGDGDKLGEEGESRWNTRGNSGFVFSESALWYVHGFGALWSSRGVGEVYARLRWSFYNNQKFGKLATFERDVHILWLCSIATCNSVAYGWADGMSNKPSVATHLEKAQLLSSEHKFQGLKKHSEVLFWDL